MQSKIEGLRIQKFPENSQFDFLSVSNPTSSCQENGTVVVTNRDLHTLLEDIEARFRDGSGFSLATLNLDHLVKLRNLKDFRDAYGTHTYVTADGNPVVWLCKLAGQRVTLLPGSELVDPLAALAEKNKLKVAFVGSTEESLAKAAQVLRSRYSDLLIVAQISPPMDFDPTGNAANDVIFQLQNLGAELCYIALGAPKQELFASKAQREMPSAGFVSVGAGIDFVSGHQARAPKIIRMLTLEWLWRLASNPRRLFLRYLQCILIFPRAIVVALRRRRERSAWYL